MPVEAKPLFRPDVLHSALAQFPPPDHLDGFRPRLFHWAKLLSSSSANKLKEKELLPDFLTDFFYGLLGYTGPASGQARYTLSREKHVEVDGKFADAVLGRFGAGADEFVVALEGKGPTDPLDRPHAGRKLSAVQQCYEYAINLPCDWIIATSMRHTRLYYKGATQACYEDFETVRFAHDEPLLRKFVFLLGAPRVVPAQGRCHFYDLLARSEKVGRELTDQFYAQYAGMRQDAFLHLCRENPDVPRAKILQATQKLLDRILFCAFCEDRDLLPAETIKKAYTHSDPYQPRPIWTNFRGLFRAINQGSDELQIPAYNGGLFQDDPALDGLNVPEEVCRYFHDLGEYNYRAPAKVEAAASAGDGRLIDVEILGHIFEQSITDLERLRLTTAGTADPAAHKARRKKEGAFYTPAFITRYIVEQALGGVLRDRYDRLRQAEGDRAKGTAQKVLADPRVYDLAALTKPQREALIGFWEGWRDELQKVRLLDPACGSGAFLIEAFDQLYAAYQRANDRLAELRGHRTIFDVDRSILQKNLFGVDLNEEAIEICRLSLWIKTAQYGKQLASLDRNVIVGNSVVSDAAVDPKALDWRAAFPEVFAAGGFDVVVGNPPYVRQELLTPIKPHLESAYQSYHGMADLYVYFYELGLRALKPGGRLSFVVTNKWMKAGYAEPLRRFFAEQTWIESVVDFGHAKQIFEDADVFPCIVVVRKPTTEPKPTHARLCTIPREQLRIDDLSRQIDKEGATIRLSQLASESWQLEDPKVPDLLSKIGKAGIPLTEFAGAKPYRGVVTGCNEAFLIPRKIRDELIATDPSSAAIIKPFLRGQDISRWTTEWHDQYMIFARRGVDISSYPAINAHLSKFRAQLEPKPASFKGNDWRGRKSGSYKWFEIQDSVDYWKEFEKQKIFYQVIQFHPRYALDQSGTYGNDKTFFIPTADLYLLAVLNSPLMWWRNWRLLTHLKDEALSPMGYMMEAAPIAKPSDELRQAVQESAARLISISKDQSQTVRSIIDWLKVEYEITKPNLKLESPLDLNVDSFLAEVRKVRGKSKPLTAAAVKNLRDEYTRTIEPARALAAEALGLENKISDLVNAAYGLTPDEIKLMWDTAPPRMPIPRPK